MLMNLKCCGYVNDPIPRREPEEDKTTAQRNDTKIRTLVMVSRDHCHAPETWPNNKTNRSALKTHIRRLSRFYLGIYMCTHICMQLLLVKKEPLNFKESEEVCVGVREGLQGEMQLNYSLKNQQQMHPVVNSFVFFFFFPLRKGRGGFPFFK